MSVSVWTPSIAPIRFDQTVYLVLNDFGRDGRCYRETEVEHTDLEDTISDLMTGQYNNPVAVVAFNVAEQWASDVSADIAVEIRRRSRSRRRGCVDRHAGWERLTLRLA